MGWPYHFVTLDDPQKDARRQLLDWYAALAQISVIAPLLAVQLHFLLSWIQRRSQSQADRPAPGSPSLKHSRLSDRAGARNLALRWRKFLWWCGGDVDLPGLPLGTKGQLLGTVAWMAWLVLLCFLQTGDDYLHMTKRFGIVAASQLPFHYLLALKTPFSPLQLLARASHESLNSIHQLLGRVITVLVYAHAVLYMNFYALSSLLPAKLGEGYVLCGVAGVIILTLIGTSSLAPVRKRSYRIFLTVHILLSTVILPVLYFHVSHIRIYIYEVVAIWIVNLVLRTMTTRTYNNATLSIVPNSQLVEISIPLGPSSSRQHFEPGQHGYISLHTPGSATTPINKNPFTLSTLPSVDGRLRFIARALAGNTKALAAAATSGQGTHRVSLEGPYGVTTHPNKLLTYDRVLLIAGGVGGTFVAPLYRQLLSDLSPGKGSHRRQKVSFLWIARSAADVAWALPEDEAERDGFLERLRVCVTQPDASSLDSAAAVDGDTDAGLGDKTFGVETEGGIELEERANLLPRRHVGTNAADGEQGSLPLYAGRPEIVRLVDQAFSYGPSERVAVVVCGPRSLGAEVRRAVGSWVRKGREVWFWKEEFAL